VSEQKVLLGGKIKL